MPKQIEVALLDYQARLMQAENPYLALIGGTGSGKTWFLSRWLLYKIAHNPGHSWIVSSPTYSTLKREPWKQTLEFFLDVGLSFKPMLGDLKLWVEDYNAIIYFISAENPDRMQGTHAKGIIGDEAGLFSELWWNTAVQRIGRHKGQILLLTTPYFATHWLRDKVVVPWLNGNKSFHVERPRTADNPYYPREEIERARETLPSWRFRMMYEGEFTRPEGLVYPEPHYVPAFDIPDNWPRIRGIDFGYQNPTAIVWLAQDPSSQVWHVYREIKASELVVSDIVGILTDTSQDPTNKASVLTYGDPSSKGLIEDLKRHGIKIRSANNDVLPGIMSVTEAFTQKKLAIFDNLIHIKDELATYHWKRDKTGMQVDAPVKENDHLVDALRYVWHTYIGDSKRGQVRKIAWSLAR